jgi:hypothetical protein
LDQLFPSNLLLQALVVYNALRRHMRLVPFLQVCPGIGVTWSQRLMDGHFLQL